VELTPLVLVRFVLEKELAAVVAEEQPRPELVAGQHFPLAEVVEELAAAERVLQVLGPVVEQVLQVVALEAAEQALQGPVPAVERQPEVMVLVVVERVLREKALVAEQGLLALVVGELLPVELEACLPQSELEAAGVPQESPQPLVVVEAPAAEEQVAGEAEPLG
jgi:hypothetical protein